MFGRTFARAMAFCNEMPESHILGTNSSRKKANPGATLQLSIRYKCTLYTFVVDFVYSLQARMVSDIKY